MDPATIAALSKAIGGALSRLLSYTFGGLLGLLVFWYVDSVRAADLVTKLGWELVILGCVVIGAGIYRAHRSGIIPIHHWIACFLFRVWDKMNRTPEKESVSPTRWFKSLEVERCRRILAYNILRHDPSFMTTEEQERLDLIHAEYGLVVMAAEACFVAAPYTAFGVNTPVQPPTPAWWVWFGIGVLLFAVSYPAPLQEHAIECLRWRDREENERDDKGNKTHPVSTTLRKYGLLRRSQPNTAMEPSAPARP